jgi:hypothetical protein
MNGYPDTAEGTTHAFITGPDGGDLGRFDTLDQRYSSASAIKIGRVAGYSYTLRVAATLPSPRMGMVIRIFHF